MAGQWTWRYCLCLSSAGIQVHVTIPLFFSIIRVLAIELWYSCMYEKDFNAWAFPLPLPQYVWPYWVHTVGCWDPWKSLPKCWGWLESRGRRYSIFHSYSALKLKIRYEIKHKSITNSIEQNSICSSFDSYSFILPRFIFSSKAKVAH